MVNDICRQIYIYLGGARNGGTNLYVRTDSGINSTKDLIGKKVGITNGYGGSRHNIALRFFANDNIKPEEVDYTVVDESSCLIAMENGEIDGVILQDMFAQKFEDAGEIKIIRSQLDEDFAGEPCCAHYLNEEFVRQNPVLATKIGQALDKASVFIEENPEETVEIAFENNWITGEFDLALDLIQAYDWTIDHDTIYQTLLKVASDYQDFGLLSKDLDPKNEVDDLWLPYPQNH